MKLLLILLTCVLISSAFPTGKKLRLLVDSHAQRLDLIEKKLAVLDWIVIDHLARWKRDLRLEMEDYLTNNVNV
jgi:hypothetical protein